MQPGAARAAVVGLEMAAKLGVVAALARAVPVVTGSSSDKSCIPRVE